MTYRTGVAAVLVLVALLAPAGAPAQQLKVEVKAANRAAIVIPAADPAEQEVDDPFLAQYRPVMRNELELARQVCDLAPEQRPTIKAAAEEGLKLGVKRLKDAGGRIVGGNAVMVNSSDGEPGRSIREQLVKALKITIAPEQFAAYEKQVADRAEQRKHAIIVSVVSRLDDQLYLTAEQRDVLCDGFAAHWEAAWDQWTSMLGMQGNYIPMIPDRLVLPHLNADQKVVFSGLRKINFSRNVVIQNDVQDEEDDAWWDAKPVAQPGKVKSVEPQPVEPQPAP